MEVSEPLASTDRNSRLDKPRNLSGMHNGIIHRLIISARVATSDDGEFRLLQGLGAISVRLGVMVPHLLQEMSGIAPWLEPRLRRPRTEAMTTFWQRMNNDKPMKRR